MKHGVAEFTDGKIMTVWDGNNDGRICLKGEAKIVLFGPTGKGLDNCGVWWDHCEPLPEKKTRPMTREEMVIEASKPYRAIRYNSGDWQLCGYFDFDATLHKYEWCDTSSGSFGPPQKFEVDE